MVDDADETVAATLSQIRHDLRTPVGHIIGYAEMMEEDLVGEAPDEVIRDLQSIKSSGERLVTMIEEHLGGSQRSLADLDLPAAQFQLRMQLNHISGYNEMLAEVAEDEGWSEVSEDLGRIALAQERMLQLIEDRLTVEAFQAGEPVDAGAAEGPEDSELQLHPLAQGGSLLVVDDDATNRDLLDRRLTRDGFDVTLASSGQGALDAIERQAYDLILLDLLMDGLSGLETLQRLKANPNTAGTPVVMLSAGDDLDPMVACILAGADDYLTKPIHPVLLRARLGASLEKVRLRQKFTRQLKIFISSPGDVIPERRLVKQVIQQLDDEYSHEVQLLPVLWEEEPLLASETFQSQIVEPRDTDIYLGILWSRIGSPLPDTMLRPDGSQYDSGTAYEFEDAMGGFREHGKPDILIYRKTGSPLVSIADRQEVMERLDQAEKLQAYIDRWFRGADGSYIGALHQFADLEELESMTLMHLRKLIDKWLADQAAVEPSGTGE
jgi:DNA-binding response OmpR family regulator